MTRQEPNRLRKQAAGGRHVLPAVCSRFHAAGQSPVGAGFPRPRGWAGKPRSYSAAFTLIELLVVISIIVLMVGLAVPVIRVLTGNRSVDAAQNQVAAFIGQARAEAIGTRANVGAFFYVNPLTRRMTMTLVTQNPNLPAFKSKNPKASDPKWIEGLPDRDSQVLQPGVDLQFINGAVAWAPGQEYRQDDIVSFRSGTTVNYYQCTSPYHISGVNGRPPNGLWKPMQPGPDRYLHQGLILFDSRGELIAARYAVRAGSQLAQAMGLSFDSEGGYSQFGIVMYDQDAFKTPGFTDEDAQLNATQYDTNSPNDEKHEEEWLDNNALPFLVNRYSGALIRGQ